MNFFPLTINDKDKVNAILHSQVAYTWEMCFNEILLWPGYTSTQYAILDGLIVFRCKYNGDEPYFRVPMGIGDKAECVKKIIEEYKTPIFQGVPKQELKYFDTDFFEIIPHRNAFDYCYDIEKLATLKGKKMNKKRNHWNAFSQLNYELRDLNPQEAKKIYQDWFGEHKQATVEMFNAEKIELEFFLDNYEDFPEFDGNSLYVDGKLVAFCISQKISDEMIITHFEKANPEIRGSFVAINKLHSENLHAKYPSVKYINREEDGGIEGLRKAKLSYYPDFMVEKYTLVPKK